MKYVYYIIILIFGYLLLAFPRGASQSDIAFSHEKITIKTSSGEQNYDAEVAVTSEQLERGLMYRKSLVNDAGMLFVLNGKESVAMWMKNTLIPLDVLFIDKNGKIVYIAKNTKPNSLDIITAGNMPIDAVLELNAGVTEKNNINVGDMVIYSGVK